MKGLETLSKLTQNTTSRNKDSWVKLYYSIFEDKVFTEDTAAAGSLFITYLINPNTPEDIENTVNAWLNS